MGNSIITTSNNGVIPDELIHTQAALGKLINRSVGRTGKLIKDPRWIFGPAPWKMSQVPKMLEWLIQTLEQSKENKCVMGVMPALRQEKIEREIERIRIQAKAMQAEYDKKMGKLIAKDDAQAAMLALINGAKSRLLSLASRLSPLVRGLDEASAYQVIEKEVQDILRNLADPASWGS